LIITLAGEFVLTFFENESEFDRANMLYCPHKKSNKKIKKYLIIIFMVCLRLKFGYKDLPVFYASLLHFIIPFHLGRSFQ